MTSNIPHRKSASAIIIGELRHIGIITRENGRRALLPLGRGKVSRCRQRLFNTLLLFFLVVEKCANSRVGKTAKKDEETDDENSSGDLRGATSSAPDGYSSFMSDRGHYPSFSWLSRGFAVFYLGTGDEGGQCGRRKKHFSSPFGGD
ncbi:hypothetical protein [Musicola paradisiaca]|uniref:hypothetical protein n=1 Tax=Musicola paradisiaca TaxID=69223 RepID=UPI00188594FC|nr:hypothetical protein [Musicola paradisiaca]